MKVAFSVGDKSKELTDRIKGTRDDIEFYTYRDVKSLINESMLRHLFFERIVFAERMLGDVEGELNALNNYIIENSESSTVVLIVPDANSEGSRIFNELFRSPLYTMVIANKTTVTMCKEIICDDISTVKAKYYTMVLEGGSTGEPRKGKFGLFGRSKNVSGNQSSKNQEMQRDGQNALKSGRTEVPNSRVSNSESYSRNIPESGRDGSGVTYDKSNNSHLENQSSSLHGDVESPSVFSDFNQEDDFLGLGSYGEDHSDSGFLDESEIESEMPSSKENTEQKSENIGVEREEKNQKSEDIELDTRIDSSDINWGLDVDSFTKVTLITGERGVGVTSAVVDVACELYNRTESVLLVDCDYKRNGLLSFIDVRDFYDKGCEDGIDTKNPYVEEEADIVSNGYGASVSKSSLLSLLSSREILSSYDRIILDCPLDCLNVISERSVRGCTVIVLVKGNRVSLTSTSIGLTDRAVVEAGLEKYIMSSCIICLSNCSDEIKKDIEYVKETIMFPNGCWVENII